MADGGWWWLVVGGCDVRWFVGRWFVVMTGGGRSVRSGDRWFAVVTGGVRWWLVVAGINILRTLTNLLEKVLKTQGKVRARNRQSVHKSKTKIFLNDTHAKFHPILTGFTCVPCN